MQTDVRAVNDVDYVLDVTVPAEDLQPQIDAALKRERAQMNLKGFRPGKVPLNVVRKMVGPQVSIEVAERAIGEAYRTAKLVHIPEPEDVACDGGLGAG